MEFRAEGVCGAWLEQPAETRPSPCVFDQNVSRGTHRAKRGFDITYVIYAFGK
jgi:hypothetical protein